MATQPGKIRSYFSWHSQHFMPFYLSEHQNPKGRMLHYGACAAGVAGVGAAIATGSAVFILAGIAAGYLQAWTGHEKFERNMPATFKVPLGSLMGDYMMTAMWLTGRLKPAMEKYGLDPDGKNPVLRDLLPLRDYRAMQSNPAHEPTLIHAQRGKTILGALLGKRSGNEGDGGAKSDCADDEVTLVNRYRIQSISTDVVWGAAGSRPVGVLAVVFDRATKEKLNLVVSEDQLRQGRTRNTGRAREEVDAALAAIDAEYKTHSKDGILYGPLSVVGRGPGH